MLTAFEQLSDNARIWIYQADKALNEDQKKEAVIGLEKFLRQWAAHGSDLKASGTILHDQFLVIGIDESFQMASGCSIDSSVHFMQDLGQNLGINFFERTNLIFMIEGSLKLIKLNEMKAAVQEGHIGPDSLFFENTIQSKGQMDSGWLVKAGETWLKRYFKAALSV